MEKQLWWKILGVLILIYVFIVGLLVPLKPGILRVSPDTVNTGEAIELKILGYNSNYSQAEDSLRAWLKLGNEYTLAANKIRVRNDRELAINFQIPDYLPSDQRVQDFTLVLDNELDGYSQYPNAVFVRQDSINPDRAGTIWTQSPIQNLNLSEGMSYPYRNILVESIRNTYFHVALWLAMTILFLASVYYSIQYLRKREMVYDDRARAYIRVGLLFGILGLVTGMVWAKYTWGEFWSDDIKQRMTAVGLLVYCAYFILRSGFPDPDRAAVVSAAYSIFAFVALIILVRVIPRLSDVDSLHPGAGGNVTFGSQDLDHTMRMVFYPAIIGWTLIGVWMATLQYRMSAIKEKLDEKAYLS